MDARLARIGRLAAVAQGLEREGAYNGAKLLRAALESELVRYNNVEAPSGGADVAAALVALVAELGADLPPAVAALLPAVADRSLTVQQYSRADYLVCPCGRSGAYLGARCMHGKCRVWLAARDAV